MLDLGWGLSQRVAGWVKSAVLKTVPFGRVILRLSDYPKPSWNISESPGSSYSTVMEFGLTNWYGFWELTPKSHYCSTLSVWDVLTFVTPPHQRMATSRECLLAWKTPSLCWPNAPSQQAARRPTHLPVLPNYGFNVPKDRVCRGSVS